MTGGWFVMPAQAGIQKALDDGRRLDPSLRWGDGTAYLMNDGSVSAPGRGFQSTE